VKRRRKKKEEDKKEILIIQFSLFSLFFTLGSNDKNTINNYS
jgi:hypothetical protein